MALSNRSKLALLIAGVAIVVVYVGIPTLFITTAAAGNNPFYRDRTQQNTVNRHQGYERFQTDNAIYWVHPQTGRGYVIDEKGVRRPIRPQPAAESLQELRGQ